MGGLAENASGKGGNGPHAPQCHQLSLSLCFHVQRESYLTWLHLFAVQDFNIGDLALRSSSTYVMGTAMEFCTLQAHHMGNING